MLTGAVLIILGGLWSYRLGRAQPTPTPTLKVAVVDVSKVLTECQENLDREKAAREKERNIKAELTKMQSQAQDLREELENVLKPNSEEYQKQMLELYNKMALLEAYQKGQEKIFASETQAWMETFYQKFLDEVKKIARTEGVSLVLNKDEQPLRTPKLENLMTIIRSRKVLYNSATLDLTARVIQNLDQAYNRQKAAGANPALP